MRKQLQFIPIEFPVVRAFIHYFIEHDHKKAQKFLLDKGYDCEISGSGLSICKKDKDPIVWIRSKKAHIVAHEMIHAVSHMFDNLGISRMTADNEELFAYYIDYAIEQIMK